MCRRENEGRSASSREEGMQRMVRDVAEAGDEDLSDGKRRGMAMVE